MAAAPSGRDGSRRDGSGPVTRCQGGPVSRRAQLL